MRRRLLLSILACWVGTSARLLLFWCVESLGSRAFWSGDVGVRAKSAMNGTHMRTRCDGRLGIKWFAVGRGILVLGCSCLVDCCAM